MSRIAVVTDSSAGVDQAWAAEHGVWIVPLLLEMDGQTLRDGVDISNERFYEVLPTCARPPQTSQARLGDLIQLYQSLHEAGYEGIVAAFLSLGISNTCATAEVAAREVDIPVEVVDTLCTASATLFCVETAVRAIAQGASLAEVAEITRRVAVEARSIFAVDTLDYLVRGGRLSATAALVGSMLQLKPLLGFVDGKIVVLERVRTSSRAVRRQVEVMAQWVGADTPVIARVVRGVSPEYADQLRTLALEQLQVVEMRSGYVPAILGAHTGPSIYSLCCLPVEYALL